MTNHLTVIHKLSKLQQWPCENCKKIQTIWLRETSGRLLDNLRFHSRHLLFQTTYLLTYQARSNQPKNFAQMRRKLQSQYADTPIPPYQMKARPDATNCVVIAVLLVNSSITRHGCYAAEHYQTTGAIQTAGVRNNLISFCERRRFQQETRRDIRIADFPSTLWSIPERLQKLHPLKNNYISRAGGQLRQAPTSL